MLTLEILEILKSLSALELFLEQFLEARYKRSVAGAGLSSAVGVWGGGGGGTPI